MCCVYCGGICIMAYRRYKRRYRRFKRAYRRRFRGRRRGYKRRRLNQNTSYKFTRVYNTSIAQSGIAPTANGFAFFLSDLNNYTEFSSLFDFYRIRGVKITFIPRQTENPNNQDCGHFYWVADYDDVIAPSPTAILEKQGVKYRYSVGKPFSVFIRPVASLLVYNGALSTTAYAQARRRMWIDMANPSVPYYGLKWVWTQAAMGMTMDVVMRYYVECKGVQ